MLKTQIGKTKNNYSVWVDLDNSHALTHLKDTPELLSLVKEILPVVAASDGYTQFEYDFKKVIGSSDLVETEDNDHVVYAKRPLRDTYTRFVKNKKPQPSSWVTIWLETTGENKCELVTAYIGKAVPPFPGDEFETPESKIFWVNHALAWGTQEVVPETETTKCPWV